ncbi:MAG: hypothetical protein ACRENI_13370, partial [Gemmatimonadaceae bacterium]
HSSHGMHLIIRSIDEMLIRWLRGSTLATWAAIAVPAAVAAGQEQPYEGPRFEVTVSPALAAGAITGRLVVVVAKDGEPEPRLTISPQGPCASTRSETGAPSVRDSQGSCTSSPATWMTSI